MKTSITLAKIPGNLWPLAFATLLAMAGCATTQPRSEERAITDGVQIARSVVLCKAMLADVGKETRPRHCA